MIFISIRANLSSSVISGPREMPGFNGPPHWESAGCVLAGSEQDIRTVSFHHGAQGEARRKIIKSAESQTCAPT